jgi:hypothetical protein
MEQHDFDESRTVFEIHTKRSQNCHRFCKMLSQQKHVVLQSTAPLQLKTLKSWQQNGYSSIRPSVAEQEKNSVAKLPDSLTRPVHILMYLVAP